MAADPKTCPDDATFFRPIQYLGSKWRLLDDIERTIAEVARPRRPRTLDLFSGTGVVAARLGQAGPVTAVDVQEYARVLASAQLRPVPFDIEAVLDLALADLATMCRPAMRALLGYESRIMASPIESARDVCELVEHGSMAGMTDEAPAPLRDLLAAAHDDVREARSSVITRHYGGVYFSYRQALTLDALATAIRDVPADARDTATAVLLSTASELVASVGGHFAQPVRPRAKDGTVKYGVVTNVARSRSGDATGVARRWATRYAALPPARYPAAAVRGDFRGALQSILNDVGCVYADPPYTRDHYSRFYHVLETLALGDEPGISRTSASGTARPSRGLYRRDRYQSPFCVVSQAPAAFAALMEPIAATGTPLVLSYSPVPRTEKPRARVMALDALVSLASEFFGHVDVRPVGAIAHAKLNHRRLNATRTYDAEVLVICRP